MLLAQKHLPAGRGLSFDLQPHSASASPLVLLGSPSLQCYPASPSPCQLGMVKRLDWLAERWMCPVVQDGRNCLESSLSGHFPRKAAVCSLYRSRRSLKNWVCHDLRSSGNESWHLDLCLRSATAMPFPRPSLSCSWRSYLNPSLVRAAHAEYVSDFCAEMEAGKKCKETWHLGQQRVTYNSLTKSLHDHRSRVIRMMLQQ